MKRQNVACSVTFALSGQIRKALDKHQSLHFIPPRSQARKLCADNELDGLVPLLPGRFCVRDFQKKTFRFYY